MLAPPHGRCETGRGGLAPNDHRQGSLGNGCRERTRGGVRPAPAPQPRGRRDAAVLLGGRPRAGGGLDPRGSPRRLLRRDHGPLDLRLQGRSARAALLGAARGLLSRAEGSHPANLIRGSSTATRMSVTVLSSTTKNDPNITITSTGGTSSCPIDWAAYWPTPCRLKTDSVRIAPPPITAAKSSPQRATIGSIEVRSTWRISTRVRLSPFALAVRT